MNSAEATAVAENATAKTTSSRMNNIAYRPQSSSASRFTAGAAGFFLLIRDGLNSSSLNFSCSSDETGGLRGGPISFSNQSAGIGPSLLSKPLFVVASGDPLGLWSSFFVVVLDCSLSHARGEFIEVLLISLALSTRLAWLHRTAPAQPAC